jgi:ferrochelatase
MVQSRFVWQGMSVRTGVLLVNLGTPDSPSVADVRRYLREFLMDPRVIDIPYALRWLLVHVLILPARPARSARAYASVWRKEGSPLLAEERLLERAVAQTLGDRWAVELAMRYGSPSIAGALEAIMKKDVDRIVVVPLFPQYASASTGSAIAKVFDLTGSREHVPGLRIVGEFYEDAGFVNAFARVAEPRLAEFRPDHVLFSYHGLPERQIRKCDPTGAHCLASSACCDRIGPANRHCYRAQCFATTRALAAALRLDPASHSIAFQSRLGRTPWIKPYTDLVLPELRKTGKKRLAIMCPAFVADCLETVEEIGIRARAQWLELGGEDLLLVPSLNAHPAWIEALCTMIREAAGAGAREQIGSGREPGGSNVPTSREGTAAGTRLA